MLQTFIPSKDLEALVSLAGYYRDEACAEHSYDAAVDYYKCEADQQFVFAYLRIDE